MQLSTSPRRNTVLWAVGLAVGLAMALGAVGVWIVFDEVGESRVSANESSAKEKLRTIDDACQTYRQELGYYPSSFAALADAHLVAATWASDSTLGGGTYLFDYSPRDEDKDGRVDGYLVTARPAAYGRDARRSFLVDQGGSLYGTEEDREPNKDDYLYSIRVTMRRADVGARDDAERLIEDCGTPSLDDSTAYDYPRPPIPTRTIEYKKHNLRFVFVPGSESKLGDPPPYRWKLVGITEAKNWVVDPNEVRVVERSEALREMPCWGGP